MYYSGSAHAHYMHLSTLRLSKFCIKMHSIQFLKYRLSPPLDKDEAKGEGVGSKIANAVSA